MYSTFDRNETEKKYLLRRVETSTPRSVKDRQHYAIT